ncbi:26S proteasome regulatory subunit 4 [Colletotrichum trifolii]|uniref:26S proteasome regulatory subunit 4 n=1 Tax=Colletotrichum trifolii TaxID=5466 RepID=A0A4R8QWY6_COLTR|nr:26S proteasome regulatory subunit 4 [Colletotrichum trifolii]
MDILDAATARQTAEARTTEESAKVPSGIESSKAAERSTSTQTKTSLEKSKKNAKVKTKKARGKTPPSCTDTEDDDNGIDNDNSGDANNEEDDLDDSDSSDDSDEELKPKSKSKSKNATVKARAKTKAKAKSKSKSHSVAKKGKKSKKARFSAQVSDSSSNESTTDLASDSDLADEAADDDDNDDDDEEEEGVADEVDDNIRLCKMLGMTPQNLDLLRRIVGDSSSLGLGIGASARAPVQQQQQRQQRGGRNKTQARQTKKRTSTNGKPKTKTKANMALKRVDQIWDNSIHNYKLQETKEAALDNDFEGSVLQVRRTFDWEGKYKATIVDIKSKSLRECLQDVIGDIRGVSLVEETPKLDPNLLFLYLEDLRKYRKELRDVEPDGADRKERKKQQKHIDTKRAHLKVLIKYLDKDYDKIKKSLYPMLENGLITFDLFWALWKPKTLIYTNTYGSPEEPRLFKVEQAVRIQHPIKGNVYWIDGKYFEYDGKRFGYGTFSMEIGEFSGARKITSLDAYPLDYHKNKQSVKANLIERGKKFVRLGGVHYRSHEGMAYYKTKKSVLKVNVNGRIMVDPAIHRRINPNYQVSAVRSKNCGISSVLDEDDSDESGCCDGSDDEVDSLDNTLTQMVEGPKSATRTITASKDIDKKAITVDSPENGTGGDDSSITEVAGNAKKAVDEPEFSDEEYLLASPVVLGFSFSEKLWLELTVSGVKEIQWNESAYDSLVLPPEQKEIVKALVESHKYHAAESIDDVIQGKGKGLVAVLHGPPGTGKTLTAEGISELLKCPLYMVSAGELGTDSGALEQELQRILDICHAWGAILLLDEADIFLEKRNLHEIGRNALVSIFLRQLEYFQGILFLTTNRVETFDDAFQSRIHIALKYDRLTSAAKKAVFKIFVERVRVQQKVDLMPFTEDDYNKLAKYDLNGRQIKNTISTAQALAINKGEPLSMQHIKNVLDVQISFDIHLKGGTGYQDALNHYT